MHHAFVWSESAGMRDVGTLGGRNSQAWGINNLGEVVGGSDVRGDKAHAFLWRPGRGMQDLGTLGGRNSEARRVNDAGEVVGTSETATGNGHAFIWTAAHGMEDLGTLGGAESRAIAISQTGRGRRQQRNRRRHRGKPSCGPEPMACVSLGNLPKHRFVRTQRCQSSRAGRGNSPSPTGRFHPWIWTEELGMRRLPTLGEGQGYPGISNESGQLVGFRRQRSAGTPRCALDAESAGSGVIAERRNEVCRDAMWLLNTILLCHIAHSRPWRCWGTPAPSREAVTQSRLLVAAGKRERSAKCSPSVLR